MPFRHIIATGALVTLIGSTPEITQIAPATPGASNDAQTLTITGKEFLPGLTLEVQTPDSRTLSLSGNAINVRTPETVSASAILDRAGAYTMKIINTDGGQSAPFSFQVRDRTPESLAIVIDRVSPASPVHGDQAQTIRLEGRNLDSGIAITVTDPAGSDVTGVSIGHATSTSIDVTVLLNQRGEYVLQASNYAGATSNRVTLRVQ